MGLFSGSECNDHYAIGRVAGDIAVIFQNNITAELTYNDLLIIKQGNTVVYYLLTTGRTFKHNT